MRPEWITALATLVYAGFTLWIILEMRRDRRSLHQPILVAQLKDANYPDWMLFTVKNIGKGPALECIAFFEGNEGTKWKLKNNIPPIGSNETYEMTFIQPQYEKDPFWEREICLAIRYKDIFKKTYKQKIFLELKTLLSFSARHAGQH
jgi:hypothetical protein